MPDPEGWLGHYWAVGYHTDGQWINAEEDWSEFTPRLAVNHKLSKNVNIYANYSKGYKAGGFNTFALNLNYDDINEDGVIDSDDGDAWVEENGGGAAPDGSTLASFDPETVDSFEIGMKGNFLENTLKVNLATYYFNYNDFQGQFISGGSTLIKNIGEAEGKGVEFDITYIPSENLRLFLSSAIQDSEVVEGLDPDGESLAGQKLTAPDVTLSFIGSYYWYLDNDVDVSLQLSYSWQTETFGSEFINGNDVFEQDSYSLTSLQLNASSGSWQLSAYIDNLTDETYYDSGENDTGLNRFGIGRGRNAGISLKYLFE